MLSSKSAFWLTAGVLFVMLLIIWVPSFSNMGDLYSFAQEEELQNISLLNIFEAELLIIISVATVLINFSKDKQVTDGRGRVNRHLILYVWISGQVLVAFVAGGFLVHQDTSWYQATGDVTTIMPAQATILLVCYPAYLFFGGGACLYTKTRLPVFLEGKQAIYLILAFAPFVFLPYYKGGVSVAPNQLMEIVYLAVYWLLSTSWLVIGVLYLVVQSAKEVFDGLQRPYDEGVY